MIVHLIIIIDGKMKIININENDNRIKKYNIYFKYISIYIIWSNDNRIIHHILEELKNIYKN